MKPYEPRHDKTNKMSVRPEKTQTRLGIRPLCSESLLCDQWVAKGPRFLHTDSEYSDQTGHDQTGRMPMLIWVYAGRTVTLLVLSCRGSYRKYHNRSGFHRIIARMIAVWRKLWAEYCTAVLNAKHDLLSKDVKSFILELQSIFLGAAEYNFTLIHISQDFIGQIMRMSKFSQ